MQGKHNTMIKRIVDVCMTVLLLCLMAYQVTGEALHEWIGIVGEDVLLCRNMLKSRPSGETRLPCSGLIKILHCDQSQIGLVSSIKPL